MKQQLAWLPVSAVVGLATALVLLLGLGRSAPAQASPDTLLCVQAGNPNCFFTIGGALAAAHAGDTIKVAAGTYIEFVTITQTVTLQGGWNAQLTQRDPLAFPSIILPPSVSFSVVYIHGVFGNTGAVAPTLDGFTIQGGGGGNHGGGLRIVNSNAIVSHNVISGNVGYLLGGGVWVQNGAPVLSDNTIANNRVIPSGSPEGGGVELENTQATLTHNLIAGNAISASAGYGGGVAIEGGGPVTLTNNTIIGNVAATITSTASPTLTIDVGVGGGIYVANAPVQLTGNVVQSNAANGVVASGSGGAFGYGGGIDIVNSPAFTLTSNTLMSNTAGYKYNRYLSGGGLQIASSSGSLANNVIAYNHANGNNLFGNGAGIAVFSSTLSVRGGQIRDNVAANNCEGYGGGLYAFNSVLSLDGVQVDHNCAAYSPVAGLGSGLAFFGSPYTLTNMIVTRNGFYNQDTAVGGIYADSASPGLVVNSTFADNLGQAIRVAAPLTLTNDIILGATTGVSATTATVTVSATFNDFYNNISNTRGVTLGVSDIVINPQLDTQYHLLPGSPVMDAGTRRGAPDTDIDGQPRPMAGSTGYYRFDIGADEFTGPAQVQRRLGQQPADFTLIGPGNPQENPGSTGSNDWIGRAVAAGDVNGDGRSDLIAGAPNLSEDFDNGPNDTGRTFVLFNTGARRLGAVDLYTSTASLEVRSNIHQQHTAVAFANGDFNGDGARDLIIGGSGDTNFGVTGTVFIFSGGPGLTGTRTLSPAMQANYRLVSDQNTASFGGANALASGQLNGAGPDDVAVAEGNATVAGRAQAGAVYVFFGSQSLPPIWNLGVLSASLTIWGPAPNADLGRVVVADVNGDGQPDLVARTTMTVYVFYGPLAAGVIDLATDATHTLLGNLNDGPLAAGDVDGDGRAEIVAGNGSQVTIVKTNPISVWGSLTGVTPSALLVADWNGDGKGDVVIGDRLDNRAYVFNGRAAWPNAAQSNIDDQADWIIYGENALDQFGYSLGSGDLDADGGPDLIIGSRSHDVTDHPLPNFKDAGAVYVLYGFAHPRTYLPLIQK